MYKVVAMLFSFLVTSLQFDAQILPQEGGKLCWRIIGFAFPAEAGAIGYKIEIASGNYDTESSFEKNIVASVPGKRNRIIAEVPSFGCQYTWRAVSESNNHVKAKSTLYHFSTKITPDVDTAITRLRIIKRAGKYYKDAYIFLDGTRVLYDMKGRPVWFLPGTDLKENQDTYPRDLKLTPQGTITFISGHRPYEITYHGTLVWMYKSNAANNNTDTFHHAFTRLRNGHYMAMVLETRYERLPAFKDRVALNAADSVLFYHKYSFTDLVEYDANNHILWRWNGLDYINKSDLRLLKITDGMINDFDLHENAFYFDEQDKTIYLSFRDISRVIKIKYPEGNILNTYGTTYKPGMKEFGNDFFCGQHACGVSRKGYLNLYDNNTCGSPPIPKIVMMRQPAPGENGLKKIWEYQCTIEDTSIAASSGLSFNKGGNVLELPDGSMFVSMDYPYSKVFIVSLDKEILWSAVPEKYDVAAKKWSQPVELYRASIIPTRNELERLIWNGEGE